MFSLWKIKGFVTRTERFFGIPAQEMDFVTYLDDMEQLTEQGRIDRGNAHMPTGLVRRVLYKTNDLLFERSF